MEITGQQIRKFRKAAGLDQLTVASKLGISNTKLCRIETGDKPFPVELLDRLYLVFEELNPNSPIARSASRISEIEAEEAAAEKERQRAEKLKSLAPIETLATIGKTYRYKDFIVVPSQYYARWSGQETKYVNEAIERLALQNRLEKGEHFFKLTYEEARDFCDIAVCDLDSQEVKKGLVLITYSAVNRLTHHFQDPNSVARSNLINDTYTHQTQIQGEMGQRNFTTREQIKHMIALGSHILSLEQEVITLSDRYVREKVELENKIEEADTKLDAKIDATDAKIDATDAKLEAKIEATDAKFDAKVDAIDAKIDKVKNDASLLDRDQLNALEDVFSAKNFEYGHGCVQGMLQSALKRQFLLKTHGNTWKCIASRDFEAALQFSKNWVPNPAQLKTIKDRIAADDSNKSRKKAIFYPTLVKPIIVPDPIPTAIVEKPKREGGVWTVTKRSL